MPKPNVPDEVHRFIEESPVAMALGDPAGDNGLILVNQRFGELTGYSQKELAGRNCRVLQRAQSAGRPDRKDANARARIRDFLDDDALPNLRTSILNFRKDGTPFVNLLYMSRLRSLSGRTRFIVASQFDVSRAQPQRLLDYDRQLSQTLTSLCPVAADNGIYVEGILAPVADSAATIAQAKLTIAGLDDSAFPRPLHLTARQSSSTAQTM